MKIFSVIPNENKRTGTKIFAQKLTAKKEEEEEEEISNAILSWANRKSYCQAKK